MGNKLISSTTVKLGIYEESADPQLVGMLGQVKEFEDGRKFVLCFSGGTLTAGILVQSPAQDAYDEALLVNTAAGAGDKEIEITVTSGHGGYDKDALKDGYMVVGQESGDIGTFYKIKGNDAMVSATTATIFLYDPLTTALAATTNEVAVCFNPYNHVITGTTSAPVIGVPIMAITDNRYFWALFAGIGPATDSSATIAAGDYVSHVGGDVVTQDGTEDGTIGIALTAAAANDALLVKYTGLD